MRKKPVGSSRIVRFAIVFFSMSVVFPARAWAYVDPMSGSILLQALAAGALAFGWTVRRYWRTIVDTLRRVSERLRGP